MAVYPWCWKYQTTGISRRKLNVLKDCQEIGSCWRFSGQTLLYSASKQLYINEGLVKEKSYFSTCQSNPSWFKNMIQGLYIFQKESLYLIPCATRKQREREKIKLKINLKINKQTIGINFVNGFAIGSSSIDHIFRLFMKKASEDRTQLLLERLDLEHIQEFQSSLEKIPAVLAALSAQQKDLSHWLRLYYFHKTPGPINYIAIKESLFSFKNRKKTYFQFSLLQINPETEFIIA